MKGKVIMESQIGDAIFFGHGSEGPTEYSTFIRGSRGDSFRRKVV
jgi:hypothetical protein